MSELRAMLEEYLTDLGWERHQRPDDASMGLEDGYWTLPGWEAYWRSPENVAQRGTSPRYVEFIDAVKITMLVQDDNNKYGSLGIPEKLVVEWRKP